MANLAKLVEVSPEAVASLEAKLRSPETSLPEKYRVLFSLRNIQGPEAHEALSLGALIAFSSVRHAIAPPAAAFVLRTGAAVRASRCFAANPSRPQNVRNPHTPSFSIQSNPIHSHAALKDPSALFRHDVAFCMGQRQDPAAVEVLQAILRDQSEHAM